MDDDGPIRNWLKNRKPLLGQSKGTYKYPLDYIFDLQRIDKKLSCMIASLGSETATEDERKHLQQAQSRVRLALERFEDAERSGGAAW